MRIFVGNLPRAIEREQLQYRLEQFGSVREIVLVTDRETGLRRSFGFVEMNHPSDAVTVVRRLDGTKLGGRRLRVRAAHPRPRAGGIADYDAPVLYQHE